MAEAIVNFYIDNTAHLRCWEPEKSEDFYDLSLWRARLAMREKEMSRDQALYLVAMDDCEQYVIGLCTLSNISRGAFQACYLGYSIDQKFEGKGLMSQLVSQALKCAFLDLNLHRVMANYIPSNTRSAALLKRLGFEEEGYAKKYLKINGQWEDHVLTSLAAESATVKLLLSESHVKKS